METEGQLVAGYLRVSDPSQIDTYSIEAQKREIATWCEREGHTLVGFYIDLGVSAYKDGLAHRPEFVRMLEDAASGKFHMVVFHTLDPYELEFPLQGVWRFEGLENDGELVTQPARIRDSYLKELDSFVTKVRSACMNNQADYVLVNTADPIESVISSYLLQRTAAAKGIKAQR